MSSNIYLPGLVTLAVLAAGCDPQADASYKGEPLASLHGTVQVAEGQAVAPDVFTSIVWHDFADSDSAALSEPVAVEGSFPAEFALEVYEPPPSSVLYDVEDPDTQELTGKNIAIGYIAVLPPDTPDGDMQLVHEAALGIDNDHLLVYADQAVDEALLRGVFPGGLVPGYQLFRVTRPDLNAEAEACRAPFDACSEACFASFCSADGSDCQEGLLPCIEDCEAQHDTSQCPEYVDDQDQLEPTAMTSELSIILGGPKLSPDWF